MSAQATRITETNEFNMLPVFVAVLIIIFTYVLLKQLFGRSKGNNVILIGLEGAGYS